MFDPRNDRGGPKPWVVVVGFLIAAAFLGLMILLHLSGAIGPGLH